MGCLQCSGFVTMPNFRLQIPNAHFHKHWHDSAAHKGRIVTWHNQAARKHRRRENRLAKAIKNFPRPVNGLLRPVVHCQTIRYNMKKRAGEGFTLEELKEAKVNRKEARTIGISVDFRRKNRSEQSLRENVARLSEYKANLIVFPKKCNRKKPQATDSSKDAPPRPSRSSAMSCPSSSPSPRSFPTRSRRRTRTRRCSTRCGCANQMPSSLASARQPGRRPRPTPPRRRRLLCK